MPSNSFLRSFRIVAPESAQQLVLDFMALEGFASSPEPFSPVCRRMTSEPFPLGSSLAARFGYIYIQDRSSMLPPVLLGPPAGAAVLDMAASPGSKSGFLAQLAGHDGFVLANEPSRDRLATLRANLQRANLIQAAISQYPGEKLPLRPASWFFAALDPPCSGWGTAEKHPKTLQLWRGAKLLPLIRLQRALLRHAEHLLAPGGRLLYSTCTTNGSENEEQTAWAADELGLVPQPLPHPPGFVYEEKGGGLLINGEASGSQGFYLSLLTKASGEAAPEELSAADGLEQLIQSGLLITRDTLATEVFDPYLLPPGQLGLFNGKVRFLPDQAPAMLPSRCRFQGLALGRYANGHFQADPTLRCALRADGPRIVFETAAEIRQFLSGAALQTGLRSSEASLWWRDLPLGCCKIKNGRPIAGR